MPYFSTYKLVPGQPSRSVEVQAVFGAEHARRIIVAAQADYEEEFGY